MIGWREPPEAIRTFKIERIERIELLTDHYSIPADFDPSEHLKDAWGIWFTEEEPQPIVLRFSRKVANRVRESSWHESQVLIDKPDGSLLWKADVAEPKEMLPWIRGWGADCEVLEPEGLRRSLMREARKLAELYAVMEVEVQLLAHIRGKDKEEQPLTNHLQTVSKLAGEFAGKIGLIETGEALGLLHDLGKASDEFQRYLLSGEGIITPDSDQYIDPIAMRGKIDHSTAGAQVIYENLWEKGQQEKVAAQVLALCIASHHSGLIDCLTPDGKDNFQKRMGKEDAKTHRTEATGNLKEIQDETARLLSDKVPEQISSVLQKLQEKGVDSKDTYRFKIGLLIRFLLSCLIDADRLDTADFELPHNTYLRNYGQYHPWQTLIQRLDKKISEFESKEMKNEVDELRNQVSQACLVASAKPKGIYQLTVPTGGGKTFSSLRFALHHADEHNMDRILYVIPYTSIIDQNADEVRKILEDRDKGGNYLDRVVLEHHSNLTPDEETKRQSLLSENWDAPVVFTTQVQFLEALFGSGTRSVRRMHQMANSVIIFDEIQTIPIRCVYMFNLAIRFLVNNCKATVVLCTATQPLLDKIEPSQFALPIKPENKIIVNEKNLYQELRRVEVFDRRTPDGWQDDEVAELASQQLQEKGSVLIVVNTKSSARSLYQAIAEKQSTAVYHLSTNMCPAHRLIVLDEIKDKLQRNEPVICVSTQLIEAGVDIDFGAVIRYLAGLDSIAQAAGRCNRHGHRHLKGNVFIVNPAEENIDKLKSIKEGKNVSKRILQEYLTSPDRYEHDLIGLEAMHQFYEYYFYRRKDVMGYPIGKNSLAGREDQLFRLLSGNPLSVNAYQRINGTPSPNPFNQSFRTAAKSFQVIDSHTRGVIVPYTDTGKEIINELCAAFEIEKMFKTIRKAQRYSVNMYSHDFEKMTRIQAVREVQKGSGIYYLSEQYYSDQLGWRDEIINPMETLIC